MQIMDAIPMQFCSKNFFLLLAHVICLGKVHGDWVDCKCQRIGASLYQRGCCNSNYEDGYIGIFPPSVKDLSFVKLEQGLRHKKILEGLQRLPDSDIGKNSVDIIMER